MKKLFYILFIFLIFDVSYSQWLSTNGPGKPKVSIIFFNNDTLYAKAGNGLYLSTNNGDYWKLLNPYYTPIFYAANSLTVFDNKLCILTDNGLFLTSDLGHTWDTISTKINDTLPSVSQMIFINNTIYINAVVSITNYGVFKSTDMGNS